MNILYICVLIYFITNKTFAKIHINKVVVRIPRPRAIGLIFDLTVVNTPHKEKERLEFRIHSDGTCCVNLTEKSIMNNAGRVIGGNFGHIEPEAAEVVSLIWPTVSLYNRVGSCPIIVTSVNSRGIKTHQRHSINFDTRFTTLDPEGRTLRSRPDYKDCKNWDKEYLKNCTPVNCEERYFGQRSFYNKSTEHCDEVPRCDRKHMRYTDNECSDMDHFFSKEDIRKIENGEYVDEFDHQEQQLTETNGCKWWDAAAASSKNSQQFEEQRENAVDFDAEFKRYLKSNFFKPTAVDISMTTKTETKREYNNYIPYWLSGVLQGLLLVGAIIFLQVFTTIAIYILICFVIFLIVSWTSRRQSKFIEDAFVIRSPAQSDIADELVITPSSLLSQR